MNIITRKKEIMEVIEKLNEATKLANDALTGLEELEKLEKKTKTTKATRMFNKNSVTIGGVEYVKTNAKPKKGDYVVFNKKAPSQIVEEVLHPVIYVEDESLPWLEHWIDMYELDYAVFTKKSPTRTTRKEAIEQARLYIDRYLSPDNYITFIGVGYETYATCKAHLTHNREKRTSTLVLRGYSSGTICHKETIKCHPDDVFNETIGEAILIARANKDEEMMKLFENAPQPTEIKEGMYIDIMDCDGDIYERNFLVEYYNKQKDFIRGWQNSRVISNIKRDGYVVKDDKDVIY